MFGARFLNLRFASAPKCLLVPSIVGMDCSSTDQEVTNEESHVGCAAALWFFPDCPGCVPGIWPIQGPVQRSGVWSFYLRMPLVQVIWQVRLNPDLLSEVGTVRSQAGN